jgi:hypothetical protein
VHQCGEVFQPGVVADQQQPLGVAMGIGQRRQRARGCRKSSRAQV